MSLGREETAQVAQDKCLRLDTALGSPVPLRVPRSRSSPTASARAWFQRILSRACWTSSSSSLSSGARPATASPAAAAALAAPYCARAVSAWARIVSTRLSMRRAVASSWPRSSASWWTLTSISSIWRSIACASVSASTAWSSRPPARERRAWSSRRVRRSRSCWSCPSRRFPAATSCAELARTWLRARSWRSWARSNTAAGSSSLPAVRAAWARAWRRSESRRIRPISPPGREPGPRPHHPVPVRCRCGSMGRSPGSCRCR